MENKKHYHVVAAVITDGDKYLCMQRCRSTHDYISEHWEFPGGKNEEGEDVYVGRKICTIVQEYPDFTITLTAYYCKGGDGEFKLLDHLDYKWLTREELDSLNWTEGDRKLLTYL